MVLVGDRTYTWNDVIRLIEKHVGKKAKVVNVKTETIAAKVASLREELLFDKSRSHCFDNSKLRDAVPEFQTSISLEEGLGETIDYLLTEKNTHVYDALFHATENVFCKKYGHIGNATLKEYLQVLYRENIKLQRLKKKLKGKG